jgi:hypothetical protein
VDEEPADVRVEQAAQRAAQPAGVAHVGAVRIALLVGERMVLAMVGHPGDHRPLDGRRAEDGERDANRPARGERAVGQVAVEADRDAEPAQHVDDPEHDEVAPVQRALPRLPHDEEEPEEGNRRDEARERAVEGLVGDWLDVFGSWPSRCRHRRHHTR